jgi:hypothetical protein
MSDQWLHCLSLPESANTHHSTKSLGPLRSAGMLLAHTPAAWLPLPRTCLVLCPESPPAPPTGSLCCPCHSLLPGWLSSSFLSSSSTHLLGSKPTSYTPAGVCLLLPSLLLAPGARTTILVSKLADWYSGRMLALSLRGMPLPHMAALYSKGTMPSSFTDSTSVAPASQAQSRAITSGQILSMTYFPPFSFLLVMPMLAPFWETRCVASQDE